MEKERKYVDENAVSGNDTKTDIAFLLSKVKKEGNANSELYFKIGQWYENGIGTVVNKEEACKWYEKSADAGKSDAELFYNLGVWYEEKGDIGKALHWYLNAKEAGNQHPDLLIKLEAFHKKRNDKIEVKNGK